MRFLPAALLAVLLLTAAPARADTVLPPGDDAAGTGEGGADIANCIDAAKRRDADATVAACSRALDGGHLGEAPTVAALINRGLALIARNEPAAAVPDFDRALQLRPEAAAFYDMRATAHAMQGDAAPAIRDYAEVIRRAVPETAGESERKLREAIALHLNGDDAAALPLFDQALRLAGVGSDDALRALLWENLALQATRQNAITPLSAAAAGRDLTQWPGPLIQYYLDRITEVELGQSLEDPDPAVSAARACAATFFVAAQALVDSRFGVAKDGFTHAQTLCPQNSLELVAARAEALVAAQPIAPDLSNDMLQCQAADANGESAAILDYCGRALSHADAPDVWRVGALTRRATAYQRNGDLEHAIADLDAAAALRPDAVDVYRQRSGYRLEKGETSGGLADLAYALTLQPDFVPGYVDRAWARLSGGDKAGALADFSKAIALQDQPRLHLGRGIVAYVAGDDAQAVADFTAVIQTSPRAPYAVLWLALSQKRHPIDDGGALDYGLAALDLQQWPGPLLRFVRGEISATELSAAAADPDPQTARRQNCEVTFYSAALARISGNPAAARAGLEQARDLCSADNIEFHAAQALVGAE
ncbi:tetratricopeptide repeat protein [Dongia sp. agr-C8]